MARTKKAVTDVTPSSDFTPDALMLRTCDKNGRAHGGFQWPLNEISVNMVFGTRAKSNTAIMLARYDDEWNVTHVFAGMVDGVTIKGDTFYELDANGQPVEVTE